MSDILIGREKECAAISALIDKRKNIIIFGPEGVGKTVILNKVLSGLAAVNIFYSKESKTLKTSLLNLMVYASCDKKSIQTADTLTLKKIFYNLLDEKKPEYIVFDHIESVEPKFYSLFTYLMERKIPLIVLSLGVEKKEIGHLRMSSFTFEKVEVFDLDRPTANLLIDHFIKEFGVKVVKTDEFKQAIFSHSKGNPKIIKALCFLARDVKYQKNDSIDVKLIDLDRRINEAVH
jgi:AAA+ ATPase superfamily predicted ATPase